MRVRRRLALDLPGQIWILESGCVVNAFGNGLVAPFVVIYLHAVRGFPLDVAGLVAASLAAAGIPAAILAGRLIDRRSARFVLAAALVVSALGYLVLPLARTPWQAAAAMVLAGGGTGAFWPAQSALLVGIAGREQRHVAFSVQRALFNAGIGAGAAVGGLIASVDRPQTYTWLFVLDAATFLAYALVLTRLRPPAAVAPAPAQAAPAGYRTLLRDRTALGVVGLNVVYGVGGYSVFEVALPIFARDFAHLRESGIGLLFVVNTIGVVVLQLPVTRLLAGRSRMRALGAMAFGWALVWLGVAAAGSQLTGTVALVALAAAVALFAAGECVLPPTQSVLVAELAPPEARGRYVAALTTSYAVGFTIGPALVGAVMTASEPLVWVVGAVVLAAAGVGAVRLDGRIPAAIRTTPARPARPEPPKPRLDPVAAA